MQDPTLATLAEQSGFARTGRTDEVTRLCAAFTQAWPKVVHTLEFGRSAEGRPMRALIACRADPRQVPLLDRKSTRLNSSHVAISYAVFCLKKKKTRSHRLRAHSATADMYPY